MAICWNNVIRFNTDPPARSFLLFLYVFLDFTIWSQLCNPPTPTFQSLLLSLPTQHREEDYFQPDQKEKGKRKI